METLHFSIMIDAPKEKVWNTMLGEQTYREWTKVFGDGSYYEGDWQKGSKILFLAPDDKGKVGGMVSRIKDSRPFEFISIEHIGMVLDGKEDMTSDAVKQWAGALENYTFSEKNGKTELLVDMDSEENYKEMFQDLWPKALRKLKKLVENPVQK